MSNPNNKKESPHDEIDDTQEISAPLVFQCAKCLTIVADSFSIL